jgi:hypothetical protein
MASRSDLSDEQRQTLWEQFVELHGDAQENFDNSVRTLAAAGVAVTAAIATALDGFETAGAWAVGLFVASLIFNLASYGTQQLDMRARMDCLRRDETDTYKGVEHTRWTRVTAFLNLSAGAAFVIGAIVLCIFVGTSADSETQGGK